MLSFIRVAMIMVSFHSTRTLMEMHINLNCMPYIHTNISQIIRVTEHIKISL